MGRGTARRPIRPQPEVLRRDAAASPLHALVREHLETFLARLLDEHGGQRLPRHVEQELRGFLKFGPDPKSLCAEPLRADPLRAPRAHAGAVNLVQRFG